MSVDQIFCKGKNLTHGQVQFPINACGLICVLLALMCVFCNFGMVLEIFHNCQ